MWQLYPCTPKQFKPNLSTQKTMQVLAYYFHNMKTRRKLKITVEWPADLKMKLDRSLFFSQHIELPRDSQKQ